MQGLTLGGRYRLDRLIGRGGMGEVWSGTDLRLRRAVAVKVLARELAADQNAVARFRREAETAAALQHPGIAVVFDVDVHVDATGQTLFLVMELLDGRDLRTVLDGAPAGLPIAQAVSFGTQIAEALAVAHEHGIVHRDIKPANLIVLPDGRVKLCDFGIAHLAAATTQLTGKGSSLGTPSYMAPEQFRAEPTDPRTDLYSLGCVLYEMLTGVQPFDSGGGLPALMYQHLNQPAPAPRARRPEIPEPLDQLVLDLLAKDPAGRPPGAQTVAAFLRSGGPPPVTRPLVVTHHQPAAGSRRMGVVIGLAGVAVVALTTAAFAVLHDSGSTTKATARGGGPATSVSPAAATPTGSADPAAATGMAQPNQSFRIGQTAQVPFLNGGDEKLAITVTSIEKGTTGDLASLNTGAQTAGTTPYYVRYSAKNLGGGVADTSGTATNMEGMLQDGQTIISTQTDSAKCKDSPPGNGQLPTGSSYEACALILVPSGDSVTGVEWTQGSSDKYQDPHGVYWK